MTKPDQKNDSAVYEILKFHDRIKKFQCLKLNAMILIEISSKIFDKQRHVTIPENPRIVTCLKYQVFTLKRYQLRQWGELR